MAFGVNHRWGIQTARVYENTGDHSGSSGGFSDISAVHSATALYAVTFRPNADGRIATVQLRWEDPDNHKVTEIAP